MKLQPIRSLPILLLLLLLTACTPTAESPEWTYSDLRLLDPVDVEESPGSDLVALYVREAGDELQLRLDLLNLNPVPDSDLYLLFDTIPGGSHDLPLETAPGIEWDLLLSIPASGSIELFSPGLTQATGLEPVPGAAVRVFRNPQRDSLEITLNQAAIRRESRSGGKLSPFSLQAITTPAGTLTPSDVTQPVSSQARPPEPVPLLLAFWNTLPAATPAQALRRWDGAHSGPEGGRHGLYNLLRTARNAEIPLVLLDLNAPLPLAALDYLENLGWVGDLSQSGQLILPAKVPGILLQNGSPAARSLLDGLRRDAGAFELPSSSSLYVDNSALEQWISSGWLAGQAPALVFYPLSTHQQDANHQPDPTTSVFHRHAWRLIPVPTDQMAFQQLDGEGLSIAARRLLVQTAIQNHETGSNRLVVLGGDLPASEWGNPQNSRQAFSYLRSHPWIRLLDGQDLIAMQTAPSSELIQTIGSPPAAGPLDEVNQHQLIDAFQDAPDNSLVQAARQAFDALLAPLSNPPEQLPALRHQYTGQVYSLLWAATWVEQPAPIANCEIDYNRDSRPDCILATTGLLAMFDNQEGALTYLFARTPDGAVNQLIGPTSQLIVGLSDPSGWKLNLSLQSDPAVIPGAFADPLPSSGVPINSRVDFAPGMITFTYPPAAGETAEWSKRYALSETGLLVEYQLAGNPPPAKIQLPLVLNPWERFHPAWVSRYTQEELGGGWAWSNPAGLRLEITSEEKISLFSFMDSRRYLGEPEDPNREYKTGHFLPFPAALAELHPASDFSLELRLPVQP